MTETPEHPARKRVLSQISETEKAMQNEREGILKKIRTDYTAAKEREDSLAAALNAQRKLANTTDQKLIQYKILKREVDSNKAAYEGMLNRLTDAGVSATFQASNIHVVEPAEVPISPVGPRRLAIAVLALSGGLVVGLAGAVLSEFL
jgi:uncharacterized protein involved in exopolysaccharide biosynthesis